MTILLTGKNGQLGWELRERLEQNHEVIAIGRDDLDFRNTAFMHDMLKRLPELSLIINTAAYTNVDQAEKDLLLSEQINMEAPAILAAEADRRNIPMIHFSTDYVFNGKKWTRPYTEQDRPDPLSVYGWSKLAGEQRVMELCGKALVFRVSSLYGTRRGNFFTTMLKYVHNGQTPCVVDDQIVSPNWTPLIAEAVEHVVQRAVTGSVGWGLYHLSGTGSTTWYEFARLIFRKASELWNVKLVEPIPVDSREFGATAKRPAYSVLNSEKFHSTFDYAIPDWQAQLIHCVNNIGNIEENEP